MIELNLNRGVDVTIRFTPEEIADIFWNNMSDTDQADFLNHLGRISAGKLKPQLSAITGGDRLELDGRIVMQLMGEWA